MAGPGVAVRCPACGTELRAFLAPTPPTQWFPCPHCRLAVPVVVPRDPPPLYSWEVLPGLYPPLAPPRAPRVRVGRAVAVALVAVAIVAAVLAGALAMYGMAATAPGTYSVSGTVVGPGGGPLLGATVLLTDNNGATYSAHTGVGGAFAFGGLPSGGVSINASYPGDAPTTVYTFVSPVYDAGSTGLTIELTHGNLSNWTSQALAPFPTLENFLASVVGATGLLALASVVAGVAAWATVAGRSRTAGVIGGGAGLAVPAVLFFLGLFPAFPLVAAATAIAAGGGAFATIVGAAELYRAGPGTAD